MRDTHAWGFPSPAKHATFQQHTAAVTASHGEPQKHATLSAIPAATPVSQHLPEAPNSSTGLDDSLTELNWMESVPAPGDHSCMLSPERNSSAACQPSQIADQSEIEVMLSVPPEVPAPPSP
jgi:hypothetical protein